MNDALGNTFMIEVVDLFAKDKVFKKHWPWTASVR
jgi:hypothetical protein